MKRMTSTLLSLIFAMGLPMTVAAMSHGDHSSHGQQMSGEMKQHGDAQHADQGKHMGHDMAASADDFTEIGKDTREGVVATVKVKTYDEETVAKMSKAGMAATHHVMVFFTDEKDGAEITSGKAAVKVKGQDGKPVMLMQMDTGFGADVVLDASAMHTFEIGTQLEDGNKRQFKVNFHNN